jgi:alpha-L-fucosidase 2
MKNNKNHMKLWYKTPPREWVEGLPVGNGRLAAMVDGGIYSERVTLNHEWLWKGVNRDRDNRKVASHLPEIREEILKGNYKEGTRLGAEYFGNYTGSQRDNRVDSYQPAGFLGIDFSCNVPSDYYRELDLSRGAVSISHQSQNGFWKRTCFTDYDKNCLIYHIKITDRNNDPLPSNMRVYLTRPVEIDTQLFLERGEGKLSLKGFINGGSAFMVSAGISVLDGELIPAPGGDGCGYEVHGSEVMITLNMGVDIQGNLPEDECLLPDLACSDFSKIFEEHLEVYKRMMGDFSLEIPLAEPNVPVNERIRLLREGKADPALTLLYFNYGRYLLLSSSAMGKLPANLQGKWNADLKAAWDSDYHFDINVEMCYWPAEPLGMTDAVEALIKTIERMSVHGEKAAMDLYGCRGIWFPITTDALARCTPEAAYWATWVGAAPWLAQHLWWHWEYTGDRVYLEKRCFPLMKKIALFFEDYLVDDGKGNLIVVPSQSPENMFKECDPSLPVALAKNCSMDLELLWDLFTHLIEGAKILGINSEKWQSILDKLPRPGIGSDGRLLEWEQEFTECEPGHRHFSHLFGLYPGEQFTPWHDEERYRAAIKSLEFRLKQNGGHTGWSRSWVACFYGRIGQGNVALHHMEKLIYDFATDSLLDLHPPRIFQIDGNMGGTAAVLEMFLQNYRGEISLLPALPDSWAEGKIENLRTKGGFKVSLSWKEKLLEEAIFTGGFKKQLKIIDPQGNYQAFGEKGERISGQRRDHLTIFPFNGYLKVTRNKN